MGYGDRGFGGGGGRFGGGGGFGGPKELFDATCSECKQPCKVPFKPKQDRPVFCRDCFAKKRAERDAA